MIDIQLYKTLLETERDEILNDLKGSTIQDPLTGEFNTVSDTSETESDDLDLDNRNEEFETDSAINEVMSSRLKDVEDALKRIEDGTYGICVVSGQPIEEERLMADPTAKTSISHINN